MKTNQELLAQLTKANKKYKLRLALKAGFNSVEEYKNSLSSKKVNLKNSIPTIHIVNIVDASSSMEGAKINAANEAIQGDIKLVKSTKDVNYTYTLVSFASSTSIITHLFMVSPEQAFSRPIGTRGTTALWQGIGQTIAALLPKVKEGDKTIVTIITDGEHNSNGGAFSSVRDVKEIKKEAEAKGFTFSFIGTKNDTDLVKQALDLEVSNTLVYDGSGKGLADSMITRTLSLNSYAKKVIAKEDVKTGFFKQTIKL